MDLGNRRTTKVIDESQMRGLVDGSDRVMAGKKAAAQLKYSDWMSKTWKLMEKM